MEFPTLSHHGGARGVTGSCHQFHLDASISLLVDCGLEQAADAQPRAETAPIGFDIAGIQALIVTHVHLDHVGRILDGLAYEVRAKVVTLGGYSEHADQAGLVEFAAGIPNTPEKIILINGESRAKNALANPLRRRFGNEGEQPGIHLAE
jgi:predicted metal-dependent RNase